MGRVVYIGSASGERDPAGLAIGPIYVFRSTGTGAFGRTARILPTRIDHRTTAGPDGRTGIFHLWSTRIEVEP